MPCWGHRHKRRGVLGNIEINDEELKIAVSRMKARDGRFYADDNSWQSNNDGGERL